MFHKIVGQWPRKEYFNHYLNNVRCTYSMTVQIDITILRHILKENGIKDYPVQIYILASAVNSFKEFRLSVSESGEPGYWDVLHPSYTIFNTENKNFSSIWTTYNKDFSVFYHSILEDIKKYNHSVNMFPQKERIDNVFDISSIPWIDFTSFNLNVYAEGTHLLPIFTIGKYMENDGKILMPLSMQLHHAACDGYHAGKFVEAVRDMVLNYHIWL